MAYGQIWEIEISHPGLNKYRHIRGTDKNVVEHKAQSQLATWDEMWEKKQASEAKRHEKEQRLQDREQKKELAAQKTEEAQEILENLNHTLNYTLDIDDTIDWENLKDRSKFKKSKPDKPKVYRIPDIPLREDPKYNPKFSIVDKLVSSRKEKKSQEAQVQFEDDYKNWELKKEKIEKKNEEIKLQYVNQVKSWQKEEAEYYASQNDYNKSIEMRKNKYSEKDPDSIYEYCDMVLTNSNYPEFFPREFDIDYNPENEILVVDYSLPSLDEIPTLSEIKYIQTKDEFKETHLSDTALKKLYDNLLYQISLRTIHELFEADAVNAIKLTVFNGWVESIDKSAGKSVNACILTVQANKDEFLQINLAQVDSKTCFKNLKGIGSSKLHSLTPVAPILKIDKSDRRFVASHDVSDGLDESYNLAAMDWAEFEHLIRELFAKEFSEGGGEVKVTQTSRDGGVDAVAFDPDPIRGGKIVIQAKRYTNVVGVSAVRDLFGTVMNEGAIKGILITTSDYGSDAYEFARAKPLTLLNGSNLLHLLEKHGTKAKIDLKEAKMILAEN